MTREGLLRLQSVCDIFDDVTANELRLMLYLRLNDSGQTYVNKMDIKISEKRLKDLVSDYKKRGLIMQRVSMGPICLSPKGNAFLDSLLVKIKE